MFTAPESPFDFQALDGHFIYTDEPEPSKLPQLVPNLGVKAGHTWKEVLQEVRRLNAKARDDESGEEYKIVYAARHGEGHHNVAEAKFGTEAWDAKWSLLNGDGDDVWGPDPPLTDVGVEQALAIKKAFHDTLATSDPAPLPTSLFTSPLGRSANTALNTWAGLESILQADGSWKAGGALQKPPRVMEGLRENFTDRHTCDQRGAASLAKLRARGWDIEDAIGDQDDVFSSNIRESPDAMSARVADALADIWARSKGEDVISITSHSGTMQALFRATRHPDFKPVPGALIPLLIKAAPRSGSNVSRQQNVAATIGADAAAASTAFAQGLLDSDSEHAVKYAASQPYKHGVVDGLLNDALLTAAREEIVAELRFTEKETDIYKVNQTGDLANLDGLPDSEVGRLQNLLRVRNAIYSEPFRAWLMSVTGCGPLSAKNKDMSINDYRAGCHLLNHDDVIGTRRLSYILYLPDPSEDWKPEYGGALELYPTVSRGVPVNVPSVVIPPKWNQYTFFTVQPGHSFHSVEEVVDPSRSRLSISGWFHRPQPDEKGFDQQDKEREEEERKEHASAEGLASKKATASFKAYPEELNPPLPGSALSTVDRTYLAQFLNPAYLQPKTQAQLFERFGDESHILLADVLRPELASSLEKALKSADGEAGLRWWEKGGRGQARIPDHQTGVTERWKIVGPPHRQRYLSLVGKDELAKPALSNAPIPQPIPTDPESVLDLLRSHLFPSPAFRHFLANVTQLVPIGARPFETRRFRPGLDYTLARADSEAVLDICLGLTPDVGRSAIDASGGATAPKGLAAKKAAAKRAKTNATKSNGGITKAEAKELAQAWETGDVGGWEAYMAPANDEEDPAVYGGNVKKPKNEEGAPIQGDVDMRDAEVEEEDDEDEDEDEDDDGVLLNITPTWNTLSIALRDEGVMKFIKYLCASAGGSRWDVVGELEVGAAIEEEDDDVQG